MTETSFSITGGADGTVRFWDVATRQIVATGAHAEGVNFVAFSPDGTTLASGAWDSTVCLWRAAPFASGKGPP